MAEELIEYYTKRYLTLCDKIKKPIPESVLKAVEKTRHIPGGFYLNSVGIKDVEDFMNKVIVPFMDEYGPSKNGDEKDVQVFLECWNHPLLPPFYDISIIKNSKN